MARGAKPGRDRADDVVRLVRGTAELGEAEQAAQFAAERELALQFRRRGLAIRLVRGIDRAAERGRQALVEGDRDVHRSRLLEQVAEKAAESIDGVDRLAVAVGHLEAHRIVGAEDEVARVDQVDRRRSLALH